MAREILLFIQPAYNCKSKDIEYAEVLIRNYRGFDTVPSILRFVHKNSIEDVFDLDVVQETLRIITEYHYTDYPIGINLCSESIAQDGIADKILEKVDEYKVPHSQLVIELNECTDFKNEIVKENVKKLRDNGIKIALDDFGIENANLYSLMSENIDILKVDKAFIDRVNEEKEGSQNAILSMLMQLCDSLNLSHVVEGIETSKQLNKIEKLGYSVVQGYLYEKPIPFQEFMNTH